jgi:hypothetical protein
MHSSQSESIPCLRDVLCLWDYTPESLSAAREAILSPKACLVHEMCHVCEIIQHYAEVIACEAFVLMHHNSEMMHEYASLQPECSKRAIMLGAIACEGFVLMQHNCKMMHAYASLQPECNKCAIILSTIACEAFVLMQHNYEMCHVCEIMQRYAESDCV